MRAAQTVTLPPYERQIFLGIPHDHFHDGLEIETRGPVKGVHEWKRRCVWGPDLGLVHAQRLAVSSKPSFSLYSNDTLPYFGFAQSYSRMQLQSQYRNHALLVWIRPVTFAKLRSAECRT